MTTLGNIQPALMTLCPDVKNPIAGFAAMIEHLDDQVGELLEVLRKENIENKTLVLFCSDNGAHREGGHFA